MSSNRNDLIQEVLKDFSGALQLKLPLEHFSQFYEQPHFNDVVQQEAKETLMNFQNNSKLSIQETWAVANELFSQIQQVIEQWKTKNEGNKTQCRQFLLSQIDFLMSDFRTSVVLKLISVPDVGLQDLETFLEGRKIVLIDIFDKLSKPGDPQSSVDMKAKLDEKLEGLKIESLEKQRLHLEQKTAERAQKKLEEAKRSIMKIAMRLKSDLMAYQGNCSKDLVKGKLGEINYFLSFNGKGLNEQHPNIYSAVLRTTAEVRKCLDEEDYKDMTAEEFAETLYEQLLYDFSEENQIGRPDSSEVDLDSMSAGDEDAIAVSQKELRVRKRNDVCTGESEGEEGQFNELQKFVEEEEIKEENDEDGLDQGARKLDTRSSNLGAGFIRFGNDGEKSEEEEENEMTKGGKSPEDNYNFITGRGSGNLNNAKKRVAKLKRSSRRRSARVQNSSTPAAANNSRRTRRSVVVETRKPMDDDECSGSSSENCEESTSDESNGKAMDHLPPKRYPVGFSKPTGSKSGLARTRLSVGDNDNPKTEKITYLHLDKNGRPIYRCNVCNRKCRQYNLKYHGEYCGKSDDPFACKECGKAHMNKANLDAHVRIHTGEKPFKCSKCSERFSVKNNLTRHLRSHVRGTRFYCKACKLGFISHYRLHDHNKSMHKGKLPFGCRYCDERFASMAMLKNHVVSHAGLRPLRCPTCDFVASIKEDLAKHIQRTHSHSRQAAQKLAIEAAIAYLVEDTKDESYQHMPERKINSLVVSHIIKKANLKLPKGAARTRKSADHPSTP